MPFYAYLECNLVWKSFIHMQKSSYIPSVLRLKGGPRKLFRVSRGSAKKILRLRGVREKKSRFVEKQLGPPTHIKWPFPKLTLCVLNVIHFYPTSWSDLWASKISFHTSFQLTKLGVENILNKQKINRHSRTNY